MGTSCRVCDALLAVRNLSQRMLACAEHRAAVVLGERAALLLLLEDLHRYADRLPPYPTSQDLAMHVTVYSPKSGSQQSRPSSVCEAASSVACSWKPEVAPVAGSAPAGRPATGLPVDSDPSDRLEGRRCSVSCNAALSVDARHADRPSASAPVPRAQTSACKQLGTAKCIPSCSDWPPAVVAADERCTHHSPPRLASARLGKAQTTGSVPTVISKPGGTPAQHTEQSSTAQVGVTKKYCSTACGCLDQSTASRGPCHLGNIQVTAAPVDRVVDDRGEDAHTSASAALQHSQGKQPTGRSASHAARSNVTLHVHVPRYRSRGRKLLELGPPDRDTLLAWLAEHGVQVNSSTRVQSYDVWRFKLKIGRDTLVTCKRNWRPCM